MLFSNLFKHSELSAKLYIKDHSFILCEKGKILAERNFDSDQELFEILPLIISKRSGITSLECHLSENKLFSRTKSIKHSSGTPFTADAKLLKSLIEEAVSAFTAEWEGEKYEIISKEIVCIKLNDYHVPIANGQKAQSLEASVFFSAISPSYKEKLLIALRGLPRKAVTFSPFSLSSAEAIHHLFRKQDFMVCRIDEEHADFCIKKSSGFFGAMSLPVGTRHVIDHLKTGLDIETEEALSYLKTYFESKLEPNIQDRFEAAILSFQISRDNEIKKALALFSEGISLPCDVYLSVPPYYHKAYEGFFAAETYHAACFTDKGFLVHPVEEKSLILK